MESNLIVIDTNKYFSPLKVYQNMIGSMPEFDVLEEVADEMQSADELDIPSLVKYEVGNGRVLAYHWAVWEQTYGIDPRELTDA